ncbi:hypothetical protein CC86DRAFT_413499 [Ophiobolus disseminans]|uniref:Uncharacterized protein n=1 Tax=Ophiobolus disseminans TaxID=1469910 RepID=A0A6A6ZF74_9PLEO|nr:hypothetical protein CC86DRAFT_413499 [Ophiobolus disseminans]
MPCRTEHHTLENHASPLRTQLQLFRICLQWRTIVLERRASKHRRRQKFKKAFNKWIIALITKKCELKLLAFKRAKDPPSVTQADWTALVNNSGNKLAALLRLPHTCGPGGANALTGEVLAAMMLRREMQRAQAWARAMLERDHSALNMLIARAHVNELDVSYEDWKEAVYCIFERSAELPPHLRIEMPREVLAFMKSACLRGGENGG